MPNFIFYTFKGVMSSCEVDNFQFLSVNSTFS